MRRRHLQAMLALLPWALSGPLSFAARAQATPDDGPWFAFLESGKPTPADRDAVMAMQRGHIDNFKRLFAAGRLYAAGPMRDPARVKRGIVVLRDGRPEAMARDFAPDAYVREGHMTLNAAPAVAHRALHTEGIDDSKVEELRIVLVARDEAAPVAGMAAARHAWLQGLMDRGTVQAWYTLKRGDVAEVLFAPGTDTAALEQVFTAYPGRDAAAVQVWPQWLSPGVLR